MEQNTAALTNNMTQNTSPIGCNSNRTHSDNPLYVSTRSTYRCNSLEAVLKGIAPDGGLFISPEILSSPFDWEGAIKLATLKNTSNTTPTPTSSINSTQALTPTLLLATSILSHLLPDFNNMPILVSKAYKDKFETQDLTPLKQVGDKYVLELFRGPTSAFKDVALSMLPQLITAAKEQTGTNTETVILTATSGDTGKAAMEGFKDVPGTRIIVFYPDGGVSPIQKIQMTTQEGSNVKVCAVRGNFDDCQSAVKQAFTHINTLDILQRTHKELSSANSINIGRLAPQVVYYFKAYADLVSLGRIKIGSAIDFVVPSGNFGDILAGYFAKLLGLPVRYLVCASNQNRVLTDFLTTGLYDRRRPFYRTSSPSMDILISSNLERLLYLACSSKPEFLGSTISRWMNELTSNGYCQVDPATMANIRQTFRCGCCTEEETIHTIGKTYSKYSYLCDPHTAVALKVADDHITSRSSTSDGVPVVVLSTASPYKFPAAVSQALGLPIKNDDFTQIQAINSLTGVPIPTNLSSLKTKIIRHTDVIDKDQIIDYVLSALNTGE